MTPTITFRKKEQVILYVCELEGQLSDGHWENATPRDHWKIMCNAEVKVGEPSINFTPRRRYGFSAPILIDAVGDRMIFYVKFYMTFPEYPMKDHWDIPIEEGTVYAMNSVKSAIDTKEGYTYKKCVKFAEELGIPVEEIPEVLETVLAYNYDESQLKKDLREMSKVVNEPLTDKF
jgi:hypothetical protein